MTEYIYLFKDACNWFFSIFQNLGNLPNWSFIGLAFLLLFWWLKLQKDYSAKAKREGTLK